MVQQGHQTRPPGPRGHWLFGNTVDYDRDRIVFLDRCQREFGDIFSFDQRTIVVSHPDLVHTLLSRTNGDFLAENAPLAVREDRERIASDAQVWTTARRAGWRGLHRAVAQAHAARLHEIFEQSLADAGGRAVDVLGVTKNFFGRATADFCVGRDAEAIPEIIAENTEAIDPLSRSSYQFPAWWPSRAVRRFVKARERTLAEITDLVRRRRADGPPTDGDPRDLLDVLLAARQPELTDLQIERLLRGVMLAAYGVPAAALTWIVHELDAHPDIRRRAVAEVAAYRGTGAPPIAALPYLEAVVKEVLRLWPPTWLIGRTARRETELGGWRLGPGDQILFTLYRLHRDPRWWRDPEVLDPERWLDPHSAQARHTYLPFGAGPRVCVGTQLGMIQLILATFWLLRDFEVTVPKGAAGTPEFSGLLVPRRFRADFRVRQL